MEAAFYLLLIIGHLGFFDVIYFHIYKCKLHELEQARTEVGIHTARHLIYGLQFLYIANFRLYGSWIWLPIAIYLLDVIIAFSDVWVEPNTRKPQGGLPRGEYFIHILLSLLVGMYLMLVLQQLYLDFDLPRAFTYSPPHVPHVLTVYMTLMGLGAVGFFVFDGLRLFKRIRLDVSKI